MQKNEGNKSVWGRVAAVALLFCPVAVAVTGAEANDPVRMHLQAEFTVETEGLPDAWVMVDPNTPVHQVVIWSDGVEYEDVIQVDDGVYMARAIRELSHLCYEVHAEVTVGTPSRGEPAVQPAMKKVKRAKKVKKVKKARTMKKVKHAKKVKKVKRASAPSHSPGEILLDLSTVHCPSACDGPWDGNEG